MLQFKNKCEMNVFINTITIILSTPFFFEYIALIKVLINGDN